MLQIKINMFCLLWNSNMSKHCKVNSIGNIHTKIKYEMFNIHNLDFILEFNDRIIQKKLLNQICATLSLTETSQLFYHLNLR